MLEELSTPMVICDAATNIILVSVASVIKAQVVRVHYLAEIQMIIPLICNKAHSNLYHVLRDFN